MIRASLEVPRHDRLFVEIAASAPLAIGLAIGLFGGAALAARWGTNAFLLLGPVTLLWLLPQDPPPKRLWHSALLIVLPLQLLLCVGQTIGTDWLAIPTRPNFPGAALAEVARTTWRQYSGLDAGPLRLIASHSWLGVQPEAPAGSRAVLRWGDHQGG